LEVISSYTRHGSFANPCSFNRKGKEEIVGYVTQEIDGDNEEDFISLLEEDDDDDKDGHPNGYRDEMCAEKQQLTHVLLASVWLLISINESLAPKVRPCEIWYD
jgi:hypothetical protein